MEYLIYRNNPLTQFVQFELRLQCEQGEQLSLKLPTWRPGRYEIANYAQKIRGFAVFANGNAIPWRKTEKSVWTFTSPETGICVVKYEFHASQMDAGGSWSDDEQLYLNFINCTFEIEGRENEAITVNFRLPDGYEVATALPRSSYMTYLAQNFQQLVDSPIMASSTLKHYTYQVGETMFHLWFQGEIYFDLPDLLEKFSAFTSKQIDAFGEFPAENYHFLYQLLPYKHYHGVEHQFSTVITFGPDSSLAQKEHMDEFFGVSCHELYHFWNVCRIRPKELLPYDFSQEVYFDTGVVAEGVTTYMGDLFLLKSGYFSLDDFLTNMEKQLTREFESLGWKHQSIAESSHDLWLDGYKPGIPDKKVSIYNRGALIATCLDLMLLDQGSSLQEVMKSMWLEFGKKNKGYGLEDFKHLVSAHHGDHDTIAKFFHDFITGTEDLQPLLIQLMERINITIKIVPDPDVLAANYGIKTLPSGHISRIHPGSPAYSTLMHGDQLTRLNGLAFHDFQLQENSPLAIEINRFGRTISIELPASSSTYFMTYQLLPGEINGKRKKWMS